MPFDRFLFMKGDAWRALAWMMCLISKLHITKKEDIGRYQYLWWGYNFVTTITCKIGIQCDSLEEESTFLHLILYLLLSILFLGFKNEYKFFLTQSSLFQLSLLMCEPYLLREAIKFVHTVNVNSLTYKLTYLHTRFPDRDFLMCATSLCPDIKVIKLHCNKLPRKIL